MSVRDPVPILDRTLAILSVFREDSSPKRVNDLLARLKIPRSSAYQIIQVLLESKYLERVGPGQVQLGPTLVELLIASRQRQRLPLPARAQAPRTFLWNPQLTELVNCSRFAKRPPYRVAFSNASTRNPWRVALLKAMQSYAERQSSLIAEFVATDAQDDPEQQVEEIRTLLSHKPDVLLVSCNHSESLNSALAAATDIGVPVLAVDRRPQTDEHFLTHISASDIALGRVTAQWLVEKLGGIGTIFMLSGIEGASPSEKRRAAAQEVFCQHPGITVAALRYTDWREEQGREITHGLVEAHGVPDGVWCDSGLQGAGSMQAFLDCGMPLATIPPHTGGDVNHAFQLAVQHRVPLAAVEYPASMGARAVQAALDVLAGKIIPRHIEVHAPIVLTRGCETASVHADVFADDYVRWDRPADYVASLDCSA